MTEVEKKVESPVQEAQANSSESWWDKFTGKNATEAAKKKMEDILDLQKKELVVVINEYKQGKTDIVGKSNQQKAELLDDVSKTLNNLKNNRGINGIVNDNLSVTEDAYEKLEAKITGTKEVIDFKNPEFIEIAIANLEQFKKDLTDASIATQEVKPVEAEKTPTTPAAVVAEVTPTPEAVAVVAKKDFYRHINFSENKKDWPAKEREAAINAIKKEINSNTELADALSKLEYSSEGIKSGKKSSVHSVKDVLLVQLALTKLEYKAGTLDGVYKDTRSGSETSVMVASFQREFNIEANKKILKEDGQVGPATLEKMIEILRAKDIDSAKKEVVKPTAPKVEVKPVEAMKPAPKAEEKPVETTPTVAPETEDFEVEALPIPLEEEPTTPLVAEPVTVAPITTPEVARPVEAARPAEKAKKVELTDSEYIKIYERYPDHKYNLDAALNEERGETYIYTKEGVPEPIPKKDVAKVRAYMDRYDSERKDPEEESTTPKTTKPVEKPKTPAKVEETKQEKLAVPADAQKLTGNEWDSLSDTYGNHEIKNNGNGTWSIWNYKIGKDDILTREQAVKVLQMQEDSQREDIRK